MGFEVEKLEGGGTELFLGLSGDPLDCLSNHACFTQILFTCVVSR